MIRRFSPAPGVTIAGDPRHDHTGWLAGLQSEAPTPAGVVFQPVTDPTPPTASTVFLTSLDRGGVAAVTALLLSLLQQYPGLESRIIVAADQTATPFVRARILGLAGAITIVDVPEPPADSTWRDRHAARITHALTLLPDSITARSEHIVVLPPDALILGPIAPLLDGAVTTLTEALTSNGTPRRGDAPYDEGLFAASLRVAATDAAAVLHVVSSGSSWSQAWNAAWRSRPIAITPSTLNASAELTKRHFRWLGLTSVLRTDDAPFWITYEDRALPEVDALRRASQARRDALQDIRSVWEQRYVQLVATARHRQFLATERARLEALASEHRSEIVLLIGNGPSIAETDFTRFAGIESYAFNWFVNHERFSDIRPRNLVVSSGFFFGGFFTSQPTWPEGFLDRLLAHDHKPRLWFPYAFRDFIESTEALASYERYYFLMDGGINSNIELTGQPELSLLSYVSNAHTGVLAIGVPGAVLQGARHIVLVGCDSNYASATGSYFYDQSLHRSQTTEGAQLRENWNGPTGLAQYSYARFAEALLGSGVGLWNATRGGMLETVPRISDASLATLLANPSSWPVDAPTSAPDGHPSPGAAAL